TGRSRAPAAEPVETVSARGRGAADGGARRTGKGRRAGDGAAGEPARPAPGAPAGLGGAARTGGRGRGGSGRSARPDARRGRRPALAAHTDRRPAGCGAGLLRLSAARERQTAGRVTVLTVTRPAAV